MIIGEKQHRGLDYIPRSSKYKDKAIKTTNGVTIKGTDYFKRTFTDNAVELVRYDNVVKKWVILCFNAA